MQLITKLEGTLNLIVMLLGLGVMIAWIFEISFLTNLVPESATMKFNTALLFVLSSLYIYGKRRKIKLNKAIGISLLFFILFVSSYSLLEYFFLELPTLDNFLIEDTISSEIFLGRMSEATSICFILFSLSNLIAFHKKNERIAHYLLLSALIISFISLVAYILKIPNQDRPFFFETMAVHTSILFIILFYISLIHLPSNRFAVLVYGKNTGSKLLRASLPIVVFLPVLFNYISLHYIQLNRENSNFNIAVGTTVFIVISLIYLFIITVSLNEADRKRKRIEKLLIRRQKRSIKNSLLDETHHRVKNNFQLVSSILQMQANNSKNTNLISILMDCNNRILAMANLHESMYRHREEEVIELDEFIHSIVRNIKEAMLTSTEIDIQLEIHQRALNQNQAIPVGLIVNELVTNSIKYAFPNAKKGNIKIHISFGSNSHILLLVEDDGIGFTVNDVENIEKDSLGTKLVKIFTSQLNGELIFNSEKDKGSSYQITFPFEEPRLHPVNPKIA